ncbi:hypothetical protein XM38_033480 [Halomicronema hongdechloris C2206]|uniref:Uncharacterized protein n=1 Tax=Halomicronema hongdechloris C2206 TaxID=1641165 RepID=A0A1Z3HQ00_9CYAN|nr:hypothetical protein XM38_033480 [Halomicronema hongdechloris C2206]
MTRLETDPRQRLTILVDTHNPVDITALAA